MLWRLSPDLQWQVVEAILDAVNGVQGTPTRTLLFFLFLMVFEQDQLGHFFLYLCTVLLLAFLLLPFPRGGRGVCHTRTTCTRMPKGQRQGCNQRCPSPVHGDTCKQGEKERLDCWTDNRQHPATERWATERRRVPGMYGRVRANGRLFEA